MAGAPRADPERRRERPWSRDRWSSCLIGVEVTAVDLADPLGHMVEEVTVVRDADNGTGILLQMLLQPVDRLGVQVVGRLIQQQYVRLLEQQSAKGHPATLASGQRIHT